MRSRKDPRRIERRSSDGSVSDASSYDSASGSSYTGSSYTGSSYTGSSYTGSSYSSRSVSNSRHEVDNSEQVNYFTSPVDQRQNRHGSSSKGASKRDKNSRGSKRKPKPFASPELPSAQHAQPIHDVRNFDASALPVGAEVFATLPRSGATPDNSGADIAHDESPLPSKAYYAPAVPHSYQSYGSAAHGPMGATTQFFFPFAPDGSPSKPPAPAAAAAGAHTRQQPLGGLPNLYQPHSTVPSHSTQQQVQSSAAGGGGDRDVRSRLRAAEDDAEDARATISVLRRRIAAYEEEMREERRSHRDQLRQLEEQLAAGVGQAPPPPATGGGVDFGEFMKAQAAAASARQAAQEAQTVVAELQAELLDAQQRAQAAEAAAASTGRHGGPAPAPAAQHPKRGGVVVDLDMGGGAVTGEGGGLARTPPRGGSGFNAELDAARAENARLEIALGEARDEIAALKRKLAAAASSVQIAEGRATALQSQLRDVQSQCDKLGSDLADAVAKKELMADELIELKGVKGGSKRGKPRQHRQPPRQDRSHSAHTVPAPQQPVPEAQAWSHAPIDAPSYAGGAESGLQGGSKQEAAQQMRKANNNAAAQNAARQRSSAFTFGDLGDGDAPPTPPSRQRQIALSHRQPQVQALHQYQPPAQHDLTFDSQPQYGQFTNGGGAFQDPSALAHRYAPEAPVWEQQQQQQQQRRDSFSAPDAGVAAMPGGLPPHMSEMQRRMDMLSDLASQQPQAVAPPRYGGGGGYSVAPPQQHMRHKREHQHEEHDPADFLKAQFAAAAARAGPSTGYAPPSAQQQHSSPGQYHSGTQQRAGSGRSPKQHAVASMQARQAATPFATAHTLDADVTAVGDAQTQLLQVNQSLDRTRAELERFGGGMGRSIADRRRKGELEASMAQFEKRASELRLWLKQNEFA